MGSSGKSLRASAYADTDGEFIKIPPSMSTLATSPVSSGFGSKYVGAAEVALAASQHRTSW